MTSSAFALFPRWSFRTLTRVALLLPCPCVVGCDSPRVVDAPDGASAGAVGDASDRCDAPSVCDAGKTVSTKGRVVEFAPGAAPDAKPTLVAGVKVCAFGHENIGCTTTDETGRYEIDGIPADARGAMTFEKTDYLGAIYPYDGTRGGVVDATLPSTAIAIGFSQIVGGTYPFTTTGVLLGEPSRRSTTDAGTDAGVSPVPQDGVSYTLTPASGLGPFYADDGGVPDTSLTATTHGAWGGGFTNVTPGVVELTFSHPTLDCSEILSGWPSARTRTLAAPVRAGFVTIVGMRCR